MLKKGAFIGLLIGAIVRVFYSNLKVFKISNFENILFLIYFLICIFIYLRADKIGKHKN
jgi:hypothetical protein